MSGSGATPGGYPAGGQYGHKAADVGPILGHVPPGARTFAEAFAGTGVVAWSAKELGLGVAANDLMAFAAMRQKVFVENDSVALDEGDCRLLAEASPTSATVREWYGKALGEDNAAFLDGLAAGLAALAPEKRDVAVCLAVLAVMRRMNYCAVSFGIDERFTGRRKIAGCDLPAEFRRLALEEFPRLLVKGKAPCAASREDALDFVARTECDVLYLDPPFPSPGGNYPLHLAFYDKLLHVLMGRSDLAGRPHNGPVPLPPHVDFSRRAPALMGISLLFRAARLCRRVIFSFNSTSAVSAGEVIAAARDWYGGLAACEWTPGRRPTCTARGRSTTANVLMVFDRGRPTASPAWNPKDVTFADFFAGIGGFRAALQPAGARCVFSSEIDEDAATAYEANWGERPGGDIRAIAPGDVPEHHVLCGGFPCPAFSGAGKRRGYADECGRLFFEIARIAAIRRPCALLLENVSAFASPDKPWLLLARETLEGIGYRVFALVLDAGAYGARTARRRTYLVCIRRDLGVAEFEFPPPTLEPVRLADVLLSDAETAGCVLDDARVRIDGEAVARAAGRPALRPIQVGRIGDEQPAPQGYRVYGDQGLAVTFCAEGGGFGGSSGLYLVNGKARLLHPREMARCMGFEDSFAIPASLSADRARRLFGNSVAVPVVRRIFDRLVETLARPT